MIFAPPPLDDLDKGVIELIERQRERLKIHTQSTSRRWLGSLRRSTFARAIQGSNSIEGYHATLDDVVAAVEDEPVRDDQTETWLAIKGYRNALTYIGQAASDPYFEFGKQFLKSLHFMMISYDMSKLPGQWRPGSIFVVDQQSGKVERLVDIANRAEVDHQGIVVKQPWAVAEALIQFSDQGG
jgi:Fic family protein